MPRPNPEQLSDATAIQLPNEHDPDINFFDLRVRLYLKGGGPTTLKEYSIPLPFELFFPLTWDAGRLRERRRDPGAIEERPDLRALPLDENAAQRQDTRKAAETDPFPVYSRVQGALERALLADQPGEAGGLHDPEFDGNGSALVSALKLALFLLRYYHDSEFEPDANDEFEAILDKAFLLLLLPVIRERFGECVRKDTLIGFDEQALAIANELHLMQPNVLHPSHRNLAVAIPQGSWDRLIATGRNNDKRFILVPLSLLDHCLATGLRQHFEAFKRDLENDQEMNRDWTWFENQIKSHNKEAAIPRRLDHAAFYPIISRYLAHSVSSFSLVRLSYGARRPQCPHINYIDIRPTVWAAEADSLATDFRLARRRLEYARDQLGGEDAKTSVTTLAELSDEVRRAGRDLFQIRKAVLILQDEIAEHGYHLEAHLDSKDNDWKAFDIVRKYKQTTRVTWTGFQMAPVYSVVHLGVGRFYVQRWGLRYYTKTTYREETVSKPITIEWRPLEEYLGSELAAETFSVYDATDQVDATATAEAEKRLRKLVRVPGDKLLNRHKDVRLFEGVSSGLRDQFGNTLEQVLREAEDEARRAILLLLVPVEERRSNGLKAVVGYNAIHNPVAPRRSSSQPRIYLVETYRQEVRQQPGHWLGPLSHTVTLFPGEVRRLKLSTQSMFVTKQQRTTRESGRTTFDRKASVKDQVRSDITSITESSSKSRWNVEASGGLNLGIVSFGGGAGGGGESSSSAQNTVKRINDQAVESVQAASASNEVQFVTSSETQLTEQSASEQIVEISNVNHGRCVTHKFFQVQHKFRSAVSLAAVRVVVEYDEDLIPGMDVARTEVFALNDVDHILPEVVKEERARIIDEIRGVARKRLEAIGLQEDLTIQPQDQAVESYANTGSFFVDTEVSPSVATEPYVERAREAEVETEKARAARLTAEAAAIKDGHIVLPASVDRLAVGTIDAGNRSDATTDVAPSSHQPPHGTGGS